MNLEVLIGAVLVLLLVAVAMYYAWRQLQVWQRVRSDLELSTPDRRYLWQQSLRRLFNSGLMVLFAGMLLGGFFYERPQPAAEEAPPLVRAAAEEALRLFTAYWVFALLVLLAIVGLAVVDLWATARFGFRHQRQLEQDRRQMLKEEADRIRRWRQQMN